MNKGDVHMNELKINIEALEDRIERLEEKLDHASTPERAELIAERLQDAQTELEGLREDYEAQMEYDEMNAWEYNGISQKDFY
jgi:predicted  nucleic acid-binding Zn-ribbon protein